MQLLLIDLQGVPTLCAPAVGEIVYISQKDEMVCSGDTLLEISILSVRHKLIVPPNIQHRISLCENICLGSGLEYLQAIATLSAVTDHEPTSTTAKTKQTAAASILSPQAGRFYHRPTPEDAAFVKTGDVITPGKTIGLLEVMKTFSPVKWNPSSGDCQSTIVGDYLVIDGDDVEEMQPLIELNK
ncbi:MAG: hypothetical protein H8E25_06685 [Planctomycetes bacterium]|nr:hypothetical protein [Planctomycetota bacterium]